MKKGCFSCPIWIVATATNFGPKLYSLQKKWSAEPDVFKQGSRMKREAKQKTSFTHRQQVCREICVRVFNEEAYSKEFIERHISASMPKLLPLLARHEQEVLAYLIDRLLRYATACKEDNRMFHLPCSETKLKLLFNELVDGWRDTD